jgi:2-oxoglutarate ferredoxin oxidoreductase subunit beta
VARAIDTDAKNLGGVLRRAAEHKGTAFCEIYQNCNVFNDGAFEDFRSREHKVERQLHAEHGKPLLFGEDNKKGLRLNALAFKLEVVTVGEAGPDGKVITEADIVIHDESNASLAGMLAHLPFPEFPVVLGVLYRSERATYDGAVTAQMAAARQKPGDLDALLNSGSTWTVS